MSKNCSGPPCFEAPFAGKSGSYKTAVSQDAPSGSAGLDPARLSGSGLGGSGLGNSGLGNSGLGGPGLAGPALGGPALGGAGFEHGSGFGRPNAPALGTAPAQRQAADPAVRDLTCDYRGFACRVRVVEHPAPTLEPVLLIGGALQRRSAWGRIESVLGACATVVTVDPPGWGDGDLLPAGYGFDFLAGALDHLLVQARVGPAHVFGGSYGGPIAIRLAQHHPERVRSLVLAATGPRVEPRVRLGLRRTLELLRDGHREQFADLCVSLLMDGPPPALPIPGARAELGSGPAAAAALAAAARSSYASQACHVGAGAGADAGADVGSFADSGPESFAALAAAVISVSSPTAPSVGTATASSGHAAPAPTRAAAPPRARAAAVRRVLWSLFHRVDEGEAARFEHNTRRLLTRRLFDLSTAAPVPVLLAVGEHDAFTPPAGCAELAAACPDARFAILRDASHPVHLQVPDQLGDLMLRFQRGEALGEPDYCRAVVRLRGHKA